MSQKALSPVNVPWAAADPTLPTLRAGDLYANSGTGKLRLYSGSAWADVATAGGVTLATTVQTESGLDAGQVGTSTNVAREDHRHPITNLVDLGSAQTITGAKAFSAAVIANGGLDLNNTAGGTRSLYTYSSGDVNWRIGMHNDNSGTVGTGAGFIRTYATSHVQYINYSNGAGQGLAFGPQAGASGALSHFEIRGSDGFTYVRNSMRVDGSFAVGTITGTTGGVSLNQGGNGLAYGGLNNSSGFALINTTAATSGVPTQVPGVLGFVGQYWNGTASVQQQIAQIDLSILDATGRTQLRYTPATNLFTGAVVVNGAMTSGGVVTGTSFATSTGSLFARGSTYGSVSISGSSGGWAGITFTDYASNQTMMMNAGGFGVYDASTTTWRWMFGGPNAGTAGQWSLTNGLVPADRVSAGNFPASVYFGGTDTGISADGTNGFVRFQRGDAGHAGYTAFYSPSSVRQGYIGWTATSLSGTSDAGALDYTANGGHWFTGGLTATTVAEGNTSGSVRVYSPNNNPGWSSVTGKPLSNIKGGTVSVTFTSGTGTIAHGLAVTPVGASVNKVDGGNDGIVVGFNGPTSWTSSNLNLRASTGTTAFAGALTIAWIAFA